MADGKKIRITQVRSTIGRSMRQRRTLKALGIQRMNHSVTHEDTPQVRGMVHSIAHLVSVEEVAA